MPFEEKAQKTSQIQQIQISMEEDFRKASSESFLKVFLTLKAKVWVSLVPTAPES